MKLVLVLLMIAALGHIASPQTATTDPNERNWLIFLVTGPTKPGADDDLPAMQKAHLDNFTRLFNEGKLFLAGPVQDPAKIKRGIVGVRAPSREALMQYFSPDPYVMSGIMAVDAQEWNIDMAKIATAFVDPEAITEHRLVRLQALRPVPASVLKQHASYLRDNLKPDLDGQILRNSKFEQVMIFITKDSDAVQERLNRDPLVRLGYVAVEIMPLWMSPETIK